MNTTNTIMLLNKDTGSEKNSLICNYLQEGLDIVSNLQSAMKKLFLLILTILQVPNLLIKGS